MKNVEDSYPLSAVQEGMIFHSLHAPDSGVYVQQLVCDTHEDLNLQAFQQAWERLLVRHAVLRTHFRWVNQDRPIQEVRRHIQLPIQRLSWCDLSKQEQTARQGEFLRADKRRGFRLDQSPLLRLTLIKLDETVYRFVFTFHHALLDGRSCRLLLEELFSFYSALTQGRVLDLAEPRPFRDYIHWLENYDLENAENFWRAILQGFSTPTPFRVDRSSRQKEKGIAFGKQRIIFSEELTTALKSLAEAHSITPNTLIQGAWALLLSVYSGERDVVFGTTRACRRSTLPDAETMIGLFINTVPIRVQVRPEALLLPWLAGIREQWISMRNYEHTPLVKVQEWSDVPAERPLFESVLVFENYRLSPSLQADGGSWRRRDCRLSGVTNYPLTVAGYLDCKLLLEIVYDRSRFDGNVVERIAGHLHNMLKEIAANPHRRLRDIPIFSERERHLLLTEWNDTAVGYPNGLCVHQLFEAQAARTPENLAVITENGRLTYGELNSRANQLAHYLRGLGVGPEVVVGICMTRRLEMVIGLIGILKAGGGYLPLDHEYPETRLTFMLDDAKPEVLLTEKSLLARFRNNTARIVCLDTDWSSISRESSETPASGIRSYNLVYAIYTSGSTGHPKGVLITHRALVNQSLAAVGYYNMSSNDRRLQFAPISFDVSAVELFSSLVSGATVVLWPGNAAVSLREFLDFVDKWKLTIVGLPTSYWHELVLELSHVKTSLPQSLRLLIVGTEEALPERLAWWRKLVGSRLRWCNAYGVTECTITSTIYEPMDNLELSGSVPIGRPLANTEIYLLDQHRNLVPIGVPGEIYIGGDGLARGYLNRPALTTEAFIPHPFRLSANARLFKTGDLGRYMSDGNIEFLGRVDRQVKIRGFRVELGEIEKVLSRQPSVRQCVVVMEKVNGNSHLAAYLVAEPLNTPTASELRRYLSRSLPEYMVPAFLITLDKLPLDHNGKVDQSRLPPIRERVKPPGGRIAPGNDLECKLKAIWEEVLGIEHIGVDDNFFDLGGHSLLAFRIAARIERAIGERLPLIAVFEAPTIEQLAKRLNRDDVPVSDVIASL